METRPFRVCLICSFCSSDRGFASDFLQTLPHDGRPCLWITVPTAEPVVDFHHQVVMRAEHTSTTVNCLVAVACFCFSYFRVSPTIDIEPKNLLLNLIAGFLYFICKATIMNFYQPDGMF